MSHQLSRKNKMKRLVKNILILLATILVSGPAFAVIQFNDDFESYNLPDGGIIGGGWIWFLNAYPNFPVCDGYLFGFGPNPAPNSNGPYFVSNIGEGNTGQALNVFSDYNSDQHPAGNCVETNVFQERLLNASDAGKYTFGFDTQVTDDLGQGVQTYGFIKLINPNPPYETFVFEKIPTETGGAKSLSLTLTSDDAGKLVQWGFANIASNFLPSGRFYDNVSFGAGPIVPPNGPNTEGIPIPLWALLGMAGLLAFFGGSKLRSRKNA
jgi:hypothetical protein